MLIYLIYAIQAPVYKYNLLCVIVILHIGVAYLISLLLAAASISFKTVQNYCNYISGAWL